MGQQNSEFWIYPSSKRFVNWCVGGIPFLLVWPLGRVHGNFRFREHCACVEPVGTFASWRLVLTCFASNAIVNVYTFLG